MIIRICIFINFFQAISFLNLNYTLCQHPGKYDLVEKDYSNTNSDSELKKDFEDELDTNSSKEIPPSSLDKKIQNLIELICNVTEMEKALKEMKYDSQKAPLGKLSKNQIKAGQNKKKT